MVRSKKGWILVAIGVAMLVLPRIFGRLLLRRSGLPIPFEFWWILVVAGLVLLARDYGVFGRLSGDGTGVTADQSLAVERTDIIQATNWKRVNSLVFRRSLGVSLAAAGLLGTLLTLLVGLTAGGAGGLAVAVVSFLVFVVGVVVYLSSRTTSEEIEHDYTHRVSVRIPDLFGPHSFHLHLRQIAEDLGYVTSSELSPGRGGTQASFDEGVFLSEGGFTARRRPIASPISPFPEGSTPATLVNLTSGSLAGVLVSIAIVAAVPGAITAVVGAVLLLGGVVGLAYSYTARTRRWAELYCLAEGTVHTPTANLYEQHAADGGHARREPTISSAEASTEMIVTVGARSSRYFDERQLEQDFQTFVDRLETVAQENSYRVVDSPTDE